MFVDMLMIQSLSDSTGPAHSAFLLRKSEFNDRKPRNTGGWPVYSRPVASFAGDRIMKTPSFRDQRNRNHARPTAHPHRPHITLRPLTAAGHQELSDIASDPLVWAQHPDPARGTREGFQLFFEGALRSQGCLVAIDTVRKSLIGWSRYSNYASGQSVAIGYTFLARSHWGGATNSEMKRLMLRHAAKIPEVLFMVWKAQSAIAPRSGETWRRADWR